MYTCWGGAISIGASILDVYIINLPFAILPGLSAIVFYLIGVYFKNHRIKLWLIIISLICWGMAVTNSHIVMANCSYGMYPIDIIGACGGTLFILAISKFIKNNKIGEVLKWIGRNSLAVLIFHFLEHHSAFFSYFRFPLDNPYVMIPSKIIFCLIMVSIAAKFPFIKKRLGLVTYKDVKKLPPM